jgi:hypothetical protein
MKLYEPSLTVTSSALAGTSSFSWAFSAKAFDVFTSDIFFELIAVNTPSFSCAFAVEASDVFTSDIIFECIEDGQQQNF